MFKVIVAGSRTFSDFDLMCEKMDYFLQTVNDDIEIVSGLVPGADSLGTKYAKKRGYHVREFPARWNTFGKRAGYLRNIEMAEYADACVVFWDGKSKGTKHMITTAKQYKMPVRIVRYESE